MWGPVNTRVACAFLSFFLSLVAPSPRVILNVVSLILILVLLILILTEVKTLLPAGCAYSLLLHHNAVSLWNMIVNVVSESDPFLTCPSGLSMVGHALQSN